MFAKKFKRNPKNNLPKKRRVAGEINPKDVKKSKEEENELEEEESGEKMYTKLLECFVGDKEEQSSDEESVDEDEIEETNDELKAHKFDDVGDEVDIPNYFELHFDAAIPDNEWKKWPETVQEPQQLELFGGCVWKRRATFVPKTQILGPKVTWKSFKLPKLIYKNILANPADVSFENFQKRKQMFAAMTTYADMMYLRSTFDTLSDIRWSYCLHALNHMMKVRQIVTENNLKVAEAKEQSKDDETEYRDQGLTRPRVLIVLPFRQSAIEVVRAMAQLVSGVGKNRIMNLDKFVDEFSSEESNVPSDRKPNDFKQTFSGNTDDSFQLGISLTKKTLKLYSEFYSSDLILCSPLSLRIMITGKKDFDFLSSIEIVIFEQLEILMMQNWEHVIEIMSHLNLQPKNQTQVDLNRVKMSVIEGRTQFYRQSLLFGAINFNECFALMSRWCNNVQGQIVAQNVVQESCGTIRSVCSACKQMFNRFECTSLESCSDERFKYFVEVTLPRIRNEPHVLVFIPSYFDFVRIRNYFRKEEIDFVAICEYSKDGKIAEARAQLFHEGRKIMLYTERLHFYRRFQVKGVRHVVFYQLPTMATFYPQIVNLAMTNLQGRKFEGDETQFTSEAIFCRFDAHCLAGIFGSSKASKIASSKKKSHTFIADSIKL